MSVSVSSFIKVSYEASTDAEWTQFWGELVGPKLLLFAAPGLEIPRTTIDISRSELKPAALDTKRILAFRITRDEKLLIILEPEHVEDMGRWVSALFKTIQETQETSIPKRLDRQLSSSAPDLIEAATVPKNSTNVHRSVSVKELRKIWEPKPKLQTIVKQVWKKELEARAIKKAEMEEVSSPALQSNTDAAKETEQVNEEKKDSTSQCSRTPVIKRTVSYTGDYKEQDDEKAILNGIINPYLTRLKVRRREKLLQQLQTVVKSKKRAIKTLKSELKAAKVAHEITSDLMDEASEDDKKHHHVKLQWLESRYSQLQSQLQVEEELLTKLVDAIQVTKGEICDLASRILEKFNEEPDNEQSQDKNIETQEQKVLDEDTKEDNDPENMKLPEWTKKAKRVSRVWTIRLKEGQH